MNIILTLTLENYLGYTNVCDVISLLHFSYYFLFFFFLLITDSGMLQCLFRINKRYVGSFSSLA